MKHFPAEILCNIFLYAVVSAPRFGSTLSITVPLFVSGVCRRWHNISLSYGELWSYLSVEFDEDILGHHQGDRWIKYRKDIVEIFDTWLRKTNGCPVNFWIVCRDVYYAGLESHNAVKNMLTKLLSQQRRWRDVRIEWIEPSTAWRFPAMIATDMPLLISPTLGWDCSEDYGHDLALIDISRSTVLRRLHLFGQCTLLVGNTPTRTLTGPIDLTIIREAVNGQAVHSCRRIIEIAPNVTDLRLHFFRDYDAPSPDLRGPRRLELCDLHVLCVRFGRASAVIFDRLTLPALRALSFDSPQGRGEGEVLTNLIMRRASPLTCLQLLGDAADENTLIPILHLCPALEMLWIRGAEVSTHLFRELAAGAGDDLTQGYGTSESYPLCSVLQSFRVSVLFTESPETLTDAFIALLIFRRSCRRCVNSNEDHN